MSKNNLNYSWANQIVSVLIKIGIDDFCICPGARNTPLVYEIVAQKKLKAISVHDERNAGYFALGIAKFSNKPVSVVTTSGTAVANLLPAVIESYYSMTPLILLTADRPSELIGTGSNQTINQDGIFSSFLRYETNLGTPSTNNIKKIIKSIQAGILNATYPIPGPVHFNIPLLEPKGYNQSSYIKINYQIEPIKYDAIEYNGTLKIGERPIIVVGPLKQTNLQKHIIKLANATGALVFADPLSNITAQPKDKHIISSYEYLISYIDISPSCIIRFGTKPISKTLNNWLDKNLELVYSINSHDRFNDDVKNIIVCDPISFCDKVSSIYNTSDKPWSSSIPKLQSCLNKKLYTHDKSSMHQFVLSTIDSLESNGMLFLGNSTIVRDFARMGSCKIHNYNVIGNRGASGVDGILSTALGAASKNKGNNVLIIGDMSFLYDLNALQVTKECNINLVVVVMNNFGGQIFERLDISEIDSTVFNRFWKTEHQQEFKDIAKFHNVGYCSLNDFSRYKEKLSHSMQSGGIHIMEIKMDMNKIDSHTKKIEKEIDKLF